jgi:murein DD-endopeptidase MepM/ murein hydrolase activator NlpD
MQHPTRSARPTRASRLAPQPPLPAAGPTGIARRLVQKVTAGASLLLTATLVLVPSLPAAAVQAPAELHPDIAMLEPEAQALDPQALAQQQLEPHAAESATAFVRDDLVVHEAPPEPVASPVADGALSPERLAELQAVANSEPRGSSYGGSPAFPRTWSMLETSVVQTPFPDVAQLPVSSGFGYRSGGFHGGTDFPLASGQPIRPIANGVVSEVFYGDNPGGGGYSVFIDHNIDGQFVQSWYGHMLPGSIQVEVGQVVDVTTVIGQLGSSGMSTGPHLHLELKNSDYVSFDPLLWLQTRQMRLEPVG